MSTSPSFRPRWALPALIGALLLLALAPTAWAGSVTVSTSGATDRLNYTATAGEANHVTLEQGATEVRVTDATAAVTKPATVPAGVTCTATSPKTVVCTGIEAAQLSLGDRDDSASVTGTLPTIIAGGAGNDDLTGGDGKDTITTGAGTSEVADGRGGNDTLDATPSRFATLRGGAGADTLTGPSGMGCSTCFPSGLLDGGDDNDKLTGGGGLNALFGGNGDDVIVGGPGNDTIDGGFGADDMKGGTGTDSLFYISRTEGVGVIIDAGAQDGSANDAGTGTNAGKRDFARTDIEIVVGGNGPDSLTGFDGPNGLAGGPGADTLDGGGGTDVLCGDAQGATLASSFGLVLCSNVTTGARDTLKGGTGDDVLDGQVGADTMDGGTGFDLVSYFDRTADLQITLADGLANDGAKDVDSVATGAQPEGDSLTSIENVTAGSGNDTIVGTTGANFIAGGLGNDTINSSDGNDVLCGTRAVVAAAANASLSPPGACVAAFGLSDTPDGFDTLNSGAGDDLLDGGTEADTLNGSTGADTASYATRGTGVNVTVTLDDVPNDGAVNERDNARANVENVVGGNGDDTLTGQATTAVANVLDGGIGTDRLDGGAGNDLVLASPGADTFTGGGGFDYVDYSQTFAGPINVTFDGAANDGGGGESDNVKADVEGVIGSPFGDTITGGEDGNTLLGGTGQDTIKGMGGGDYVDGGPDVDTLDSGAGADQLVSRDQLVENVVCGADADVWVKDDGDTNNAADCESLVAAPAAVRVPRVADPRSLAFRQMRRAEKRVTRKKR